jgi:hypothetical protein
MMVGVAQLVGLRKGTLVLGRSSAAAEAAVLSS